MLDNNMAVYDRRRTDKIIPISFQGKEEFIDYPVSEGVVLTMVSNGTYTFELNHNEYCKEAPFFLCLSDKDEFHLCQTTGYCSAQTFQFEPRFINSALTKEALEKDDFQAIEDVHDRNLIHFFIHHDKLTGIVIPGVYEFMKIREWFSVIAGETQMQSDFMWTCRIRRYLLQILYLLEDVCIEYEKHDQEDKPVVDRILEYIHTNYDHSLGLGDLCQLVNMNRTSMNELFKEKVGCTVMQYLNDYRIKMAQSALIHTALPLSEVSACCGFQYESYFTQVYKKKTGMTPSDYRMEHRKKKDCKNYK